MKTLLFLTMLLAGAALAGCGSVAGSGDDAAADVVPPSIEPTDTTLPAHDGTDPTDPPADPVGEPIPGSTLTTAAFVGLTEADAAALAEDDGLPWRTVRIDDEQLAVTMDFSERRVNFGLDDGVVTEVSLG